MKKYIFAISVLLIFLAGCAGKEPKTTPQKEPFIGGTIGLLISFSEDAPPKEVYDLGGFPFDVDVKLVNDGERFVAKEDCEVKLSGIEPGEFGKTASDMKKNPDADLAEKKKDAEGGVIKGAESHVTFSNLNYAGALSGNTPFNIRADVCYKYRTTANAKLCVKENLLDAANKDVCLVNEDKKTFNSGAPVQVSEFRESAIGSDKVSFSFKVEEKGNGDIYKAGTKCAGSRSDEDKIYVKVETGITGLSCSGLSNGTDTQGYVTLYSGERSVRCIQELSQRGNYEKLVKIDLDYDYKEDITTEILVKHASA